MAKRRRSSGKTSAEFSGNGALIIIILLVIIIVLGLLFAPRESPHRNYAVPNRSPTPYITATPRSADAQSENRIPSDCAEARRMGLSARQAGRYSHLDRDGDGVACYGD